MTPSTPIENASLTVSTRQLLAPAQVGDVWYRVTGAHIGDEIYEGMELSWTSWLCVKTTPSGAWFRCGEWPGLKLRFALTVGALAICRTKREALQRLVARKVRHLRILRSEIVSAEDTLEAARTELALCEDGEQVSKAGSMPAPTSPERSS